MCGRGLTPALREEFPALRLHTRGVAGGAGRSSPELRERLLELSDRFRVALAPTLRQGRVPSAYRAFQRHIGLDPDAADAPLERALHQRLRDGCFRSRGRVHDALLLTLVETQVPVLALAEDALVGALRVRLTASGEALGRAARAPMLPAERIVLADAAVPVAALFGATAPDVEVGRRTRRTLLCCVQVGGVPRLAVEDALARTATALGG
jgi:DNA/RNA-binding domain of Phe-tRNA-synthetase-like protein